MQLPVTQRIGIYIKGYLFLLKYTSDAIILIMDVPMISCTEINAISLDVSIRAGQSFAFTKKLVLKSCAHIEREQDTKLTAIRTAYFVQLILWYWLRITNGGSQVAIPNRILIELQISIIRNLPLQDEAVIIIIIIIAYTYGKVIIK